MSDYEITCISRDGPDPDRRIDAVGLAGKIYQIDQVIAWIQSKEHRFWVASSPNSVAALALDQRLDQLIDVRAGIHAPPNPPSRELSNLIG